MILISLTPLIPPTVIPANAGIQCGGAMFIAVKDWIPDRAADDLQDTQTARAAAPACTGTGIVRDDEG